MARAKCTGRRDLRGKGLTMKRARERLSQPTTSQLTTNRRRVTMPTAERVRQLLDYNPHTGDFTWRLSRRGQRRGVGSKAGSVVTVVDPTGQSYYYLQIG